MSQTLTSILSAAGIPLAGWTATSVLFTRRLDAERRDPVTGLLTRAGWTRRAEKIVQRAPHGTVVLCDLDGFKTVNDRYGHHVGDAVLAATARRLTPLKANGGAVGRLGGDEFVAATPMPLEDAELTVLHRVLAQPVEFEGHRLAVSASIGMCRLDQLPLRSLAGALKEADRAMYAVKGSPGRRGGAASVEKAVTR